MDYHHCVVGAPLGHGSMWGVQPGWLPDVHLVDPTQSRPTRPTVIATPRAVPS